jgi:chaperonin GroES
MADMEFLEKVTRSLNVAKLIDKEELNLIAKKVLSEFDHDKASRADWEEQANRSLELAKMKHEKKTSPWEGSSNVKYPVIARAAIQFAANATAEIVRQGKAVETVVLGKDPDGSKQRRAKRIEDYLNYQLLIKDTSWQDSIDRTIQLLAIVGTVFRKVYFDPITGENCSELCLHNEIVVHNDIPSLSKARRISHVMKMHSNNIVEMMRAGVFSKVDKETLDTEDVNPDEQLHEVIEQHRYLDLDGDGYEEPYIVTVLKDKEQILRIFPRFEFKDILFNTDNEVRYIKPCDYFVDYHCIPSSDGGYYSIGFGALLHTHLMKLLTQVSTS